MHGRRRAALAATGLLAGLLPAAAGTALAADPVTVTFQYTGAEQAFTIPNDVTTLRVTLIGGRGGSGGGPGVVSGGPGGFGAFVTGELTVSPATTLYVNVGGSGGNGLTTNGGVGGFNGGGTGGRGFTFGGGGGGGGATDLRTLSRGAGGSLDSRVAVAAGGGGGAGGAPSAGGAASQDGGDPSSGSAGTAAAGGLGGTSPAGTSRGSNGGFGFGGDGGDSDGAVFGNFGGGGGGGGGLYGGGGGAGGEMANFSGGGGGGSNLIGSLTDAATSIDTTGISLVSITYASSEPESGTVEAEVTVPTSAACLELSTTAIDFGTLPLGAVREPASPAVAVTNCSGLQELVYASASDADGPGAHWALTDDPSSCADTLGLDAYRLRLEHSGDGVQLRTENKPIGSLGSGESEAHTALIDTACPGSTGAGTTLSLRIVFLATS